MAKKKTAKAETPTSLEERLAKMRKLAGLPEGEAVATGPTISPTGPATTAAATPAPDPSVAEGERILAEWKAKSSAKASKPAVNTRPPLKAPAPAAAPLIDPEIEALLAEEGMTLAPEQPAEKSPPATTPAPSPAAPAPAAKTRKPRSPRKPKAPAAAPTPPGFQQPPMGNTAPLSGAYNPFAGSPPPMGTPGVMPTPPAGASTAASPGRVAAAKNWFGNLSRLKKGGVVGGGILGAMALASLLGGDGQQQMPTMPTPPPDPVDYDLLMQMMGSGPQMANERDDEMMQLLRQLYAQDQDLLANNIAGMTEGW